MLPLNPNSIVRFLASSWRAGVVALVSILVWCAHHDRWTAADWRIPTDYYSDAQESLARLKAASEGDTLPLASQVIERLGAPFGAHWNAYPTPDKPLMLLLGGFVKLLGLYATANLGLLLAHVSAALAFYFVARWLRCRWEWAAAGALLFAYTYHTVHRGLSHISLVFTWTVPLGLLAVWLVAGSRRLAWHRPGATVCLVAAAALGASNPYNLFFWLQLLAWAVVLQWLGARRRPNLEIGVAAGLVAILAFAVVNAEAWLHVDDRGGLPLLARNYAGTEMYALKPVEMFIPPTFHNWDWLAFFGHRYTRWSGWRGEVFLPYLGIAGIVGFIWLGLVSLRRIVARRPLPGQALAVGWVIAYSAIGGVTNLLALFLGFQIFRATNRAAIFVSALVLFFLVVRISRGTARWPRWLRLGAAAAVAGLGVYEQLPRRQSAPERAEIARTVQADAELGRALESALPAGAMIFQLPVLGFPEVAPPHQLGDYEHFRPYLATNTLRFSYGSPKTRARGRWQRDLEPLPMQAVVPRLEEYGFAALYLNRKGYRDGGESVLRELRQMGYAERIAGPDEHQVVVRLRPTEQPRPPVGSALTFGRGWHSPLERGIRWAYGDAALSYFNPYPHPIPVELRMTLMGVTPRTVVLEIDGEPVREIKVESVPTPVVIRQLSLPPGVNQFTLHSSAPPVRQGQGRNQLRSFGLAESTVFHPAHSPLPPPRNPKGRRHGSGWRWPFGSPAQ